MKVRNNKQIGEIGERIAIGELAKFGIDVLLPLSDNLPFDLIIFYKNRFFKCQIKSSKTVNCNNSITFSLTSNNWNKKTKHIYSGEDFDVLILCDLENIYLFKYDEIKGKQYLNIRYTPTNSGQNKGIYLADSYRISEKRIEEVLITPL